MEIEPLRHNRGYITKKADISLLNKSKFKNGVYLSKPMVKVFFEMFVYNL